MADSPQDNTSAGMRADEITTSPNFVSNSNSTQPVHIRSCVLCRQRKVKCDRRQPCSNCIRAGANCVHPPGAGRAAKRPRQAADTKVLDRLSQLETTIRRLQQQAKGRDADPHTAPEPVQAQESRDLVDDANQGTEATPELGRLVVEESQSRYVSNIMWADLTESIEQLRGMFLDTNSRDDDSNQLDDSPPFYDAESPNLASSGPNAAILGFRSLTHSLRDFHPSVELSMRLFQLFNENVLPVVRIFHTPTLIRLFWSAVVSTDSLDKETEALLFAIYYSTIISIDPTQCANIVGAPRSTVVERYKFAAEQALARANLLNTHSTLLLQAAVLYLSSLRSDDGTRTVWSLIALVSHIARSMGLHRDGTVFNLSPFETEMRRRIWHHICLLDHRSTEYHGHEPTETVETASDTHWPLNVNDSDLSSDMTSMPPESDSPTDMILVQVRCHALRISREMNRASRSPFHVRVQLIDEHDKWVEKYVARCDPAQPLHYMAKQISYIAAQRVRVVAYYAELVSRKRKREANISHANNVDKGIEGSNHKVSKVEIDDKTLRELIFTNSISILKRTCDIMKDPRLERWVWHSHIYIQWHTIAIVLSEICIRPPSLQCDEAWGYATAVYDKWLRVKYRDSTEQGDEFVKPMGQLIARARRVRDMQQAEQHQEPRDRIKSQMSEQGISEWMMSGQQTQYDTPRSQTSLDFDSMDAIHMNPRSHPANLNPATTTTASLDFPRIGPPIPYIGELDSFLEMLPDELQSDWFQSMGRDSVDPYSHSPEILPANPFPEFP
ncbi:fungal-specific transcription factor domain-containing protein [Hypoxylon argillaceum]|nr:fungal-specific transcription factor domain-containing protein [Hypoxylon argillaceum]